MNNWKLTEFKQKTNQIVLFFVFPILFISQTVSAHHQVQHLDDYNDIACVQCLSSLDSFDSFSNVLFVSIALEATIFQGQFVEPFIPTANNFYSARAPPKTF